MYFLICDKPEHAVCHGGGFPGTGSGDDEQRLHPGRDDCGLFAGWFVCSEGFGKLAWRVVFGAHGCVTCLPEEHSGHVPGFAQGNPPGRCRAKKSAADMIAAASRTRCSASWTCFVSTMLSCSRSAGPLDAPPKPTMRPPTGLLRCSSGIWVSSLSAPWMTANW